jgi:hypothetical protein|tara:strand:+ start:296 stop:505 length:210 start_codon:yes stop_codon:yes gene_type:complete
MRNPTFVAYSVDGCWVLGVVFGPCACAAAVLREVDTPPPDTTLPEAAASSGMEKSTTPPDVNRVTDRED